MAPDRLPPSEVSQLLHRWSEGEEAALEELLPRVYDELRRLAASYLRRERADHTLQPTALVHEAYLRLAGDAPVAWQDRAHFFGIAAKVMRRVLVDHARKRKAGRRIAKEALVPIELARSIGVADDEGVLAVHEALERLAELDERQARVVELRSFGGLTNEEAATVLGVSVPTVVRDWRFARAWLRRELGLRDA